MSYSIDDIKSNLSIPQMLRKMGIETSDKADFMMKSPLRQEKTPSFHVYDGGTRAHDFGGDFSGDVIDLYAALTGKTNKDAIADCAGFAGVGEAGPGTLMPPTRKRKKGRVEQELIAPEWPREWVGFAKESAERLVHNGLSPDLNALMIRKGWGLDIVKERARAGQMGIDNRGKVIWIYPHGVKLRGNPDDSRGDRWLWGAARDNLWCGEGLMKPGCQQVWLTEGESDCLSLHKLRPAQEGDAYCGVPGASWTPAGVFAHVIGAYRTVNLMMDCDKAGFAATVSLLAALRENATGCLVRGLSWKKLRKDGVKGDDIGDISLGEKKLKKNLDYYLTPL